MVGVRVPGPICLRPFVAKCNDRRYANDWAQYGVGTYMYFRDLQRLAVLFFAMAIVSLPAMLVNINRDTGETPAPRTPHTSSVDLPRSLGTDLARRPQSAPKPECTEEDSYSACLIFTMLGNMPANYTPAAAAAAMIDNTAGANSVDGKTFF